MGPQIQGRVWTRGRALVSEAGLAAGRGLRGDVPGQEGTGLAFKLGRRGVQEVSIQQLVYK